MRTRSAVIGLVFAAAVACNTNIFAPTPGPWTLQGITWNDNEFLPPGNLTRERLAGVRVEVLTGVKAGTFAISDGSGNYQLPGMSGGSVQLRATKDGYDSAVLTVTPCGEFGCNFVNPFKLGQPPHTLWGDVLAAGTPTRVTIANVHVEIVDGPNAGKTTLTDLAGRYRFDDLVGSPVFSLRFTAAGYQTRSVPFFGFGCASYLVPTCSLRHNDQQNATLTALSTAASR